MLSTLRVASRQTVSRESGMRVLVTGVRAGSTWANVPQGPPVRHFGEGNQLGKELMMV
jgi:aspartate aminotransferase